MKIKLEFTDGTAETYNLDEVNILTDSFAGGHTKEREINQALIFGGIFEVPPPKKYSLVRKIKINARAVQKVTLAETEEDKQRIAEN